MTQKIYAGDTLDFPVSVPHYPPSAGWTLKMRLVPRFTGPVQAPVVLTAVVNAETDSYDVQATPASTAAWTPGLYGWASWVEKTGARQTLEGTQYAGELVVLPDPATMAVGTDTRSQAQKALDDLLVAYAAWTPTYKSHTVGDRAVVFNTRAELEGQIRFWHMRVSDERAAAAGRATGPLGRARYGVPN